MVAMVVGDETSIDWRELFHPETGRHVAPDDSGDALSQDRVYQQRSPGDLNQPTRVSEPGEPGAFANLRRPGKDGYVRRDTGDRRARWRASPPARKAVQDRPAEDLSRRPGPRAIGVEEAECSHRSLGNPLGSSLS